MINTKTSVAAEKTVGEIQAMLAKAKANALMIEYGTTGRPEIVCFRLTINDTPVSFRLPANWEGVHKVLQRMPRVAVDSISFGE